jgi:hypothetical protein
MKMAKKWLAYAQHYDRKSAHSFAGKSFRKHRTRAPAFDEDGHRCQRSLQQDQTAVPLTTLVFYSGRSPASVRL